MSPDRPIIAMARADSRFLQAVSAPEVKKPPQALPRLPNITHEPPNAIHIFDNFFGFHHKSQVRALTTQ